MARTEAKRLLGEVADGKDPAETRDALRDLLTMARLCERFLEEYSSEHKKPSSRYNDEANIRNHLSPLLGRLFVADVTRGDIDRCVRAIKDGKTAKDEKRAAITIHRYWWSRRRKQMSRAAVQDVQHGGGLGFAPGWDKPMPSCKKIPQKGT